MSDKNPQKIVQDAIMGEDQKMEKAAPVATWSMVALAYPIALVCAILLGFFILAFLEA